MTQQSPVSTQRLPYLPMPLLTIRNGNITTKISWKPQRLTNSVMLNGAPDNSSTNLISGNAQRTANSHLIKRRFFQSIDIPAPFNPILYAQSYRSAADNVLSVDIGYYNNDVSILFNRQPETECFLIITR